MYMYTSLRAYQDLYTPVHVHVHVGVSNYINMYMYVQLINYYAHMYS